MDIDFSFTARAVLCTYALVALVERLPNLQVQASRFLRPFFATDVLWYLTTAAIIVTVGPSLAGLGNARASVGLLGLEHLQLPWLIQVLIATVLYDLGTWVAHVLLHRYDVLWRFHKVHHSSCVLDWLATTRGHGLERFARGIPTQTILYTLGLPVSALAAALVIYGAFAVIGHSNLRLNLSWMEGLFVTPRLHRLHHIPETTNNNFGTIFTLWDRCFGTLVIADPKEGHVLGVPGEIESYPQNYWRQLIQPFRRARVLALQTTDIRT